MVRRSGCLPNARCGLPAAYRKTQRRVRVLNRRAFSCRLAGETPTEKQATATLLLRVASSNRRS
jgi:hypothetical protein